LREKASVICEKKKEEKKSITCKVGKRGMCFGTSGAMTVILTVSIPPKKSQQNDIPAQKGPAQGKGLEKGKGEKREENYAGDPLMKGAAEHHRTKIHHKRGKETASLWKRKLKKKKGVFGEKRREKGKSTMHERTEEGTFRTQGGLIARPGWGNNEEAPTDNEKPEEFL